MERAESEPCCNAARTLTPHSLALSLARSALTCRTDEGSQEEKICKILTTISQTEMEDKVSYVIFYARINILN